MVAGDRADPKVRGEACLTVTVWSPDVSASLPVMVWVPRGCSSTAPGNYSSATGPRLAANGNVVVNDNYRISL